MKHKRWIALLLAAALAVGAMGVTAFAANSTEPEAETSTEPEAETSTEESAAKSCPGRHGHKERKDKTAEPENAIGKDAAKEIALAEAGCSAEEAGKVKARVTQLEDGTVVYRVSFSSGELWRCYKIDAVSGEILDKTEEDAAAHEAAKAERGKGSGEAAEGAAEEGEAAGHGHRHGGGRHSGDAAEGRTDPGSGGRHSRGKTGTSAEAAPEEGSEL